MWAARYNLGVALAQRGRIDEAAEQLRELLNQKPDHAAGHERLGELLAGLRQDASAAAHLRRALELDDRARPPTLSRLAWLRATSFDPSVRNGEEALKLADSAIRAARSPTPALLDVLAAANAEAGKIDEAARIATRALEIAEVRREGALAAAIGARLALYKSGKPYHQDPPPTTAATKPVP
jgi:tetratricopeptide (TPR) repeat protein